jgi:hypothetical protein
VCNPFPGFRVFLGVVKKVQELSLLLSDPNNPERSSLPLAVTTHFSCTCLALKCTQAMLEFFSNIL